MLQSKIIRVLLALAATGSLGSLLRAKPSLAPQEELTEQVRSLAVQAIEEEKIEALSVAIDVGGEEFFAQGWGETSLFRIGTLTEQFIAVAMLRLEAQGKLSLDDVLTKYFPALEFGGAEITLRQLLQHTSGLPEVALEISEAGELNSTGAVEFMAGMSLHSTPGSCLEFSDSNVMLAGLVLERVAEQALPELLRTEFFEPLELADTTYCTGGPPHSDYAHVTHEFGGQLQEHDSTPQPFRADQLCSSLNDLIRWQRALVERKVVGEGGYRTMTEAVVLQAGHEAPRGLGVNLTPLGDATCLSAGGGIAGSRVHLAYYPELDLTIAVAAQGEDVDVRSLERSMVRLFLDLPDPEVRDLVVDKSLQEKCAGNYYLGCSQYTVVVRDEKLMVEPPEGEPFALRYQGNRRFISAADEQVAIEFVIEGDIAESFVLEERGARSVARRLQ